MRILVTFLFATLLVGIPAVLFTGLAYLVVGPGDFWSGAICGGLACLASTELIKMGIRG